MGVTEGFCADLYCDCDGCQSGKIYPQGQADFIGRNMTDISQQARKAGCRICNGRLERLPRRHAACWQLSGEKRRRSGAKRQLSGNSGWLRVGAERGEEGDSRRVRLNYRLWRRRLCRRLAQTARSRHAGGETIKRKHAICYQQITGLYLCE